MLNNLSNFWNIITGRMIKKLAEPSDLIPLGTRDSRYGGNYKPTAISVADFAAQLVPPVPEPTYKVFTALVTQSGGDVLIYGPDSDSPQPLQIGTTYKIEANTGGDFTNVGAPNNLTGTYFLATGTIPNSWGVPGDTQLSSNAGAPTAIVLENTIGNIWFTYQADGTYSIVSDNLFTLNKTITFTTTSSAPNDPYWITMKIVGLQEIYLIQFDVDGSGINNLSSPTPIEIRVYN